MVHEIEAIPPLLALHVRSHPVGSGEQGAGSRAACAVAPDRVAAGWRSGTVDRKRLDPAAGRGSDTLHGRIAPGHDQAAVGRQQGRKTGERRFQGLAGVVAIEMIGLDIQDHRVVGAKVQEIPAKFAGLDEDGVSVARPAAVASVSRCGAIDHRGIAARGHEDFGGHGRGGRFAMGSGDGQAAVPLHQLAEHFGIARGQECRVLRLDEVRDWRPKWHCCRSRTRHPRSPGPPHVRRSNRFLPS